MSYSEYEFGDFRKIYDSGPDAGLVGFAEGFAKGFVPAYQAARQARVKQEDDLFKLAVKDIQDREKLKATASKKLSDHVSNAKALAKNYPNLPGVEAYIYNGLVSGMTSNQISSDLQTAIKDGRVRITNPEGVTSNPFETSTNPAPTVPENEEVSSVETQTNEVLSSENTANTDTEMSAGDYLVSRMQSGEAGSNNIEGVQVADNSPSWFVNVQNKLTANRDALISRNVNNRLDAWKAATGRDVTSAGGLTTTSAKSVTSASTEIAASGDSATGVATVLSIIPKLDADEAATAIAVPPLKDINDVNDAIVAKGVADATEGPEAKKASEIAGKLITQLSDVPKIGDLSLSDLDILQSTPQENMGPKYSGLSPEVFSRLQEEARELYNAKEREGLPSLNFETSTVGEGILADIEADRYGSLPFATDTGEFSGKQVYMIALRDRIAALKASEAVAAAKIDGDDFTMDDYDLLRANELQKAFAIGGESVDENGKPLAFVAWEQGPGKFLLEFAQQTEVRKKAGEKPEVFTSPVQAAVNQFLRSPDSENLKPEALQTKLIEIQQKFDNTSKTLTSGNVAALSNYWREKQANGTEAEKAEAKAWLETDLPRLQQAVEDGSPASDVPSEEQIITFENEQGKIEKVAGRINADGSVTVSSKRGPNGEKIIIPESKIRSTLSPDLVDVAAKATARLPDAVKTDLPKQNLSAVDFANKAYQLSQLVEKNPEVLLAGGQAASVFETTKTQLGSLFEFAVRTGKGLVTDEDSGNESAILNTMLEAVEKDESINSDTKSAYRKYINQTVVLIFKAGEALGSTGQAFSNQDYNRLREAFVGATSLEDINAILRSFSADLIKIADLKASDMASTTAVSSILNTVGVEKGTEFDGATGLMKAQGLDDLLNWVNAEQELPTAPSNADSTVVDPEAAAKDEAAAKAKAEAQASLQSWLNGEAVVWTQAMEDEYQIQTNGRQSSFTVGSQVKQK